MSGVRKRKSDEQGPNHADAVDLLEVVGLILGAVEIPGKVLSLGT